MLTVVIDSNVWVSALLVPGNPRLLINRFENGSFTIIYPRGLIDELQAVLLKPRLATRIRSNDLENLLQLIEQSGFLIEPESIPSVSRDPKDDIFLACAVASHADFLVTGDKDLLCIGEYHGTRIVTPKEFLEILANI